MANVETMDVKWAEREGYVETFQKKEIKITHDNLIFIIDFCYRFYSCCGFKENLKTWVNSEQCIIFEENYLQQATIIDKHKS